ncbi:hypothetical protein FN846DRAFT_914630 [Sphaerosporella brunnea]|uniref:Uncharacterized protein n=1 Tax=Sphaerosporella brunnea TaxID=1250544 RepID=A0A5J5ED04_9PEZI|nr:hypothetical protein FN846DRAFT_914630 [Sphaerosporella brunnea]
MTPVWPSIIGNVVAGNTQNVIIQQYGQPGNNYWPPPPQQQQQKPPLHNRLLLTPPPPLPRPAIINNSNMWNINITGPIIGNVVAGNGPNVVIQQFGQPGNNFWPPRRQQGPPPPKQQPLSPGAPAHDGQYGQGFVDRLFRYATQNADAAWYCALPPAFPNQTPLEVSVRWILPPGAPGAAAPNPPPANSTTTISSPSPTPTTARAFTPSDNADAAVADRIAAATDRITAAAANITGVSTATSIAPAPAITIATDTGSAITMVWTKGKIDSMDATLNALATRSNVRQAHHHHFSSESHSGANDEVDSSDDPDLTDVSELEHQLAGTVNEPTSEQRTQGPLPVFPISSASAPVGDNAVVTVPMAFLTTMTNTMNALTTHLGTLQESHSAQAQPTQGIPPPPPPPDHPLVQSVRNRWPAIDPVHLQEILEHRFKVENFLKLNASFVYTADRHLENITLGSFEIPTTSRNVEIDEY